MLLLFVAAFHAEFLLFAVQIRTTCLGLINIWPSLVRHVKSHAEELVVAGHASKQQVTMTIAAHTSNGIVFTEMRDVRCEVSPENAMDFRPPNKILTLGSPEEVVVAVGPCKKFIQVTSTNKNCYDMKSFAAFILFTGYSTANQRNSRP